MNTVQAPLGLWVIVKYPCRLISLKEFPFCCEPLSVGEAVHVCGQGIREVSLYFSLFAMTLNALRKDLFPLAMF